MAMTNAERHKRHYIKHREKEQKRSRLKYARYKKILHNLKINGCANCGYNENVKKLVFHHVNPEDKKFQLCSRHMAYADNLIVEELNKCILLCASCHTTLHNNERWNNGKIL